MKEENLGKRVNVRVGAEIIAVHKTEPACIIRLENDGHGGLIVHEGYAVGGEEPETVKNHHEMLQKAANDIEGWEFIEGMPNLFKDSKNHH